MPSICMKGDTMALMAWNDSMSVNIKLVDGQHMKLVELLNDFHAGVKKGTARDLLAKTLEDLLEYTIYHFKTEEGLFQAYRYPGYLKHRHEHQALTKKTKDLHRRFVNHEIVANSETMIFLVDWLTTHIMGSDKQYGPFLNSKGVY